MKIIDHFSVAIQDVNGELQEIRSLSKPEIDNGFLVVFSYAGEYYYNLDYVRSWAFQIVDKE